MAQVKGKVKDQGISQSLVPYEKESFREKKFWHRRWKQRAEREGRRSPTQKEIEVKR